MSNSLKYATLNARYVLENNLTASASVLSINTTGISSFIAPSINIFANFFALSDCSPTIILDGYKLSYKARPSLKNSGENIILSVSNIALTFSVYPTGTVDLITIVACGFIESTFAITASTLQVFK